MSTISNNGYTSRFPWDKVKLGTLRTVCKDLGLPLYVSARRDDMVIWLQELENEELERVIQQQEAERQRNREDARNEQQAAARNEPQQQHSSCILIDDALRRSGREPRPSEKRREIPQSPKSKPRVSSARRRKSYGARILAAKKARFDGVELPSRRTASTTANDPDPNAPTSRSFAEIAADADESMQVDAANLVTT